MNKICSIILFMMASLWAPLTAKKLHYIHWNKNNPMFRLDNTDHIMDVNAGNMPWEYDQVNIICPKAEPGIKFPERHVIYSVSREEFDSCRITNPKPKIVAICNKPYRTMYFTITFRSFTPTPGGLEFRPGQDYYFISTSSREDLHRRVGGGCATHNMKMIFKVAAGHEGNVEQHFASDENEVFSSIRRPEDNSISDMLPFDGDFSNEVVTAPSIQYNAKVPSFRREIYYYHPKDLIEKQEDDFSNDVQQELSRVLEKNLWRQKKAMRLTSSGSTTSGSSMLFMTLVPLVSILFM